MGDTPPAAPPTPGEGNETSKTEVSAAKRPWGQDMIDAHEDEWLAVEQGTSPVVQSHDGTLNYEKASAEAQQFYAETGRVDDPKKRIVLRDPETGKLAVWQRNPKMEEGGAVRLGRLLGLGVVAGPGRPGRAAGTATKAARAGKAADAAEVKAALSRISRTENPVTPEEFARMPETGTFDPRRIRTPQDTARSTFRDGRSVAAMAEGLRVGRLKATDVEPVRIVEKDGMIWTLDHRRLIAFREAGVHIPYRKVKWKDLRGRDLDKVTTKDTGMSLVVKKENSNEP